MEQVKEYLISKHFWTGMVIAAAKAWGVEEQLGIGYYGDWIHVDTRGYSSRW